MQTEPKYAADTVNDTTFSIELKGLNLPNEVRSRLDAALRSTVMAELAKVDLGKGVSIEPLAASTERMSMMKVPFGPLLLGYIIRKVVAATERGKGSAAPVIPLPVASPRSLPRPMSASPLPFPLDAEVIEGLYCRPDVQAAIASNTRAFAVLLSQNEAATNGLNELVGGMDANRDPDRALPLLAWALCVVAGGAVGYWSRK